jgi:hypothetical protein
LTRNKYCFRNIPRVWKKVSVQAITIYDANTLLQMLDNDGENFEVLLPGPDTLQKARRLLNKLNSNEVPLKTLDAVQVSFFQQLDPELDLVVSFDKQMLTALDYLGIARLPQRLPVQMAENI